MARSGVGFWTAVKIVITVVLILFFVNGAYAQAPSTPSQMTFSGANASSFTVYVPSAPANTTTYTLERKVSTDTNYTYSQSVNLNGSNATQSGLAVDTTYTFRLKASNASGSSYSNPSQHKSTLGDVGTPAGNLQFKSVRDTTITVIVPAAPINTASYPTSQYRIQWKVASSDDSLSSWTSDVQLPYLTSNTKTISGLTPNTSYDVRLSASNGVTTKYGVKSTVKTLATGQAEFGSASITEITSTSARVTPPAFPSGVTTAQLYCGLAGGTMTAYGSPVTAGQSQVVTGLTPETNYSVLYLAGNVRSMANGFTTLPPAPGIPGKPVFSNITATSLNATSPALPMNATSMTLLRRLNSEPDSAYVTIASNITSSYVVTQVTGLSPSTYYRFVYKAIGPGGSTLGNSEPVMTSSMSLPGAPGKPTYSNVTSTSLDVTSPTLPVNATSMTLLRKLNSEPDSAYITQATGIISAGVVTPVAGLTASTTYRFVYKAIGPGGSMLGNSEPITTLAAIPAELSAFTVNSAHIQSGEVAYAKVTMTGPGGDDVLVMLSSDSRLASMPNFVQVGRTSREEIVAIDTELVTAPVTVTLSATYKGIVKSATLILDPIAVPQTTNGAPRGYWAPGVWGGDNTLYTSPRLTSSEDARALQWYSAYKKWQWVPSSTGQPLPAKVTLRASAPWSAEGSQLNVANGDSGRAGSWFGLNLTGAYPQNAIQVDEEAQSGIEKDVAYQGSLPVASGALTSTIELAPVAELDANGQTIYTVTVHLARQQQQYAEVNDTARSSASVETATMEPAQITLDGQE